MNAAPAADSLLRQALGEEAEFRDGQLEAIVALVEGHSRVLVVQRTGWGKSVVYFIATRLLREGGGGPTILISPLLSLMRDQMRMASNLGLNSRSIVSTNQATWNQTEAELATDEVDVLLISPERLANQRFQTKTLRSIKAGIGLFVVDEAHCISDWGHDFRPDYRRIERITRSLPAGVPLLATTATANDRVVADVEAQLGPDLTVVRGPLGRDSLHLQIIELVDQAERLAWLLAYLRQTTGSGIIYTLTVADARRVSSWLGDHGVDAPAYFGGMDDAEKQRLEQRLRNNDVKALVATVALGMGFDKPDLAFVIHYQRPSSAITYYQQIGRAGRGVERAEVVLLSGAEDDAIAEYFIDEAFPAEEIMRDVLGAVDTLEGARKQDIEAAVNVKTSDIDRALKILEVENAVLHEGSGWTRTINPWEPDTERIEAVSEARGHELEQMREFVATAGCLMQFLTEQLDDPSGQPCGKCANCAGPFVSSDPDEDLVLEASIYLKRAYLPIAPRKRWPYGLAARSGSVPPADRLREGMALTMWGNAGWGNLVREGKFGQEGQFADELVEAVASMVENALDPDPPPTWVTAVPSLRHPDLVPGFARRLAERLDLPYRSALAKVRETPPQKKMENGVNQAENAIDAFDVVSTEVLKEPVLLIDDMVDSGWSLTVCGVALAEAGSGPVFPVVLGDTSSGPGP